MSKTFKERLKRINTFFFDVDGVFTDGSVTIFENGEQVRKMSVKDGYAVQYAVKMGYRIAIISGGRHEGVRLRFQGLGVQDIYLGQSNKIEAYEDLLAIYEINEDEILYMGDDLPDLEVMTKVGLACCPKDAATEIREMAHYTSPFKGGQGCVRDVIEQTLKAQEKWKDTKHINW